MVHEMSNQSPIPSGLRDLQIVLLSRPLDHVVKGSRKCHQINPLLRLGQPANTHYTNESWIPAYSRWRETEWKMQHVWWTADIAFFFSLSRSLSSSFVRIPMPHDLCPDLCEIIIVIIIILMLISVFYTFIVQICIQTYLNYCSNDW